MSQPSVNFKATCRRLLTAGKQPDKLDWWAAAELIDAGHATGAVRKSRSHDSYGQVEALVNFVPTLQGRLFADDLEEELRRQTWRYRLTRVAIAIGGFLGGLVLGVTTEVGKTFILQLLGLAPK